MQANSSTTANLKLSTVAARLEQVRQDRQRANAMAAAAVLGAMPRPFLSAVANNLRRAVHVQSQIAHVC